MRDKNGHEIQKGDNVIATTTTGKKFAGQVVALQDLHFGNPGNEVLVYIKGRFSRYFRASQVVVQLCNEQQEVQQS